MTTQTSGTASAVPFIAPSPKRHAIVPFCERRRVVRERERIDDLLDRGLLITHCLRCPEHLLLREKNERSGKPCGGVCRAGLKPLIVNGVLIECVKK